MTEIEDLQNIVAEAVTMHDDDEVRAEFGITFGMIRALIRTMDDLERDRDSLLEQYHAAGDALSEYARQHEERADVELPFYLQSEAEEALIRGLTTMVKASRIEIARLREALTLAAERLSRAADRMDPGVAAFEVREWAKEAHAALAGAPFQPERPENKVTEAPYSGSGRPLAQNDFRYTD